MIISNFQPVKAHQQRIPLRDAKALISIETLFESNIIDWQYNYVCNHNYYYTYEQEEYCKFY